MLSTWPKEFLLALFKKKKFTGEKKSLYFFAVYDLRENLEFLLGGDQTMIRWSTNCEVFFSNCTQKLK